MKVIVSCFSILAELSELAESLNVDAGYLGYKD